MDWSYDWRSATYLDFLDWIQNPENLIPFCKAVNERYLASVGGNGSTWIMQTGGRDADGYPAPYVNGTYTFTEENYRFPESADMLRGTTKHYPESGYTWWSTKVLDVEGGTSAVEVARSPQQMLWQLCNLTYGLLAQSFIATHDGAGTEINAVTEVPLGIQLNYEYEDSLTFLDPDSTLRNPAVSIDKQWTTTTGGVKSYTYPKPTGIDAYRPREINNLAAPGVTGQKARCLFIFIPGGTTADAAIKEFTGRIAIYDGVDWIVQTAEYSLVNEPDWIHENRPPKFGDYIGPWILADLRDALNMMRKTIALPFPVPPQATGTPSARGGVVVQSYLIGKSLSLSQALDNIYGDDAYQHTYVFSPHVNDTSAAGFDWRTGYSLVFEGSSFTGDPGTFADMVVAPLLLEWPPSDTWEAPSGPAYNYIEAFNYYVNASINKTKFKPVISHSPILQELGIAKKVQFLIYADFQTWAGLSPYFFNESNDIYPHEKNTVNDMGSGIVAVHGQYQPNLFFAPTTVTGSDATLVGDFIGDIESDPTWDIELWEVVRGSVSLASPATHGIDPVAYGAICEWAIEGGFRYSHLTT